MSELPTEKVICALLEGELITKGKFLWGSNYTLLAEARHADLSIPVVYKPTRGERPLWDFPVASLAGREVAAYLTSQALGWDLVPPTAYRELAPYGPGSLQLFVEHDPEYHYFNFSRADLERLRPVAIFDILINNADRKGSHVLIDPQSHLWLIDHGICFHAEEKLRTVIWDFAGEPIPDELCADLHRFRTQLDPPSPFLLEMQTYLSRREIAALVRRTERLLSIARFPNPNTHMRPYPWPPV